MIMVVFWFTESLLGFMRRRIPFLTVSFFKAPESRKIIWCYHHSVLRLAKIEASDWLVLIAIVFMRQNFLRLVSVYDSIHTVSVGWLWYLFVYYFIYLVFSIFYVSWQNISSVHSWIAFRNESDDVAREWCVFLYLMKSMSITSTLMFHVTARQKTFTLLTRLLCVMFHPLLRI